MLKEPRILHAGLCVNPKKLSSISEAFIGACSEKYIELSTGIDDFNRALTSAAENFRPGFIFLQIQAPGIITIDTLKRLKDLGSFVVNWTGDVRAPLPPWYLEAAPFVDVTAFTNMVDVRLVRAAGYRSEYLEIGIDPKIYYPEHSADKDIDIIFTANNYGGYPLSAERLKLAHRLKQVYGGRFKLFGGGWGPLADGNVNASQDDEAALYRRSKIAISVSHFNYDRYASDRKIRALASGAMVLSHKYRGYTKDHKDRRDLVTFEDLEDLIRLIDFYLANDKPRQAIARRGAAMAAKYWTFAAMVQNLLNLKK